jgi:acyl carrier protein
MTGQMLELVLETAQKILGQQVKSSDNFFLIGGDSMRAVELMTTLEEQAGAEFDPTSIIDAEDMAALAASLYDQLRQV